MRARPLPAGCNPGRFRTRLLRAAAVAGLVVAAGLGAATTASAHSQLERSDPADGSQLDVLPEQITLTFNQNVLGLGDVLQVTGPAGSVSDGAPTVVDNQVTQAIRPGSPAGAYTVLWRVTSADGHPISGRLAFTAAAGSRGTAGPPTNAAAASTAPGAVASASPTQGSGTEGSGTEGSGGIDSAMVWLLIACAAVVVAAGVFLAARRPGSTQADDEVAALPENQTEGHPSA